MLWVQIQSQKEAGGNSETRGAGAGEQRTMRLQKKLERVKDPVKACRRGCASERSLLGRRDSLVG